MATLYRCKAPTNLVCRCGKVARRLRSMGIELDEVRVPLLKRDRPEIEELTGQRWVPVLVHGDEVIHDSHRILQYLEWLDSREQSARPQPQALGSTESEASVDQRGSDSGKEVA